MTIQRISGLPSNWASAKLQHPGNEESIELSLTDGVAHVHTGIAFERSFRRAIDRQADAKFRLLNDQGKKVAKCHLDLEQLRQEIDLRDNILAKIVTLDDDLNLGGIKMEFKLGYFAIDTQTSHSVPRPIEDVTGGDSPIEFDEVEVSLGVGPLGASFANTLIPPTVIRLVPLPDGSASPLADKIMPRSELIKFNGKDTTLWTLDDFKDSLIETKDDKERVMVFNVPRLTEEEIKALTAPPAVTARPAAEENEEPPADDKDANETSEPADNGQEGEAAAGATSASDAADDDDQGEASTAAAAAGVAALAVGAGAAVAAAGDQGDGGEGTTGAADGESEQGGASTAAAGGDEQKPDDAGTGENGAAQNGGGWDTSYLTNVGFTPEGKEPEAAPLEFAVSVPNYVINSEHQYVLYDVISQGLKGKETQTFRVLRRYNNFASLKAKLELELDGAALPDLPSKWTYNALFKRFEESLVEERREALEQWLQTVYAACIDALPNSDTLIDFLTAVPEHNHVLSFEKKEKVEVVVKNSGAVRLYGEGFDQPTPRNVNTNSQVA